MVRRLEEKDLVLWSASPDQNASSESNLSIERSHEHCPIYIMVCSSNNKSLKRPPVVPAYVFQDALALTSIGKVFQQRGLMPLRDLHHPVLLLYLVPLSSTLRDTLLQDGIIIDCKGVDISQQV